MIKHQWHIPIWWNVTIFIALFEKGGQNFNDWEGEGFENYTKPREKLSTVKKKAWAAFSEYVRTHPGLLRTTGMCFIWIVYYLREAESL